MKRELTSELNVSKRCKSQGEKRNCSFHNVSTIKKPKIMDTILGKRKRHVYTVSIIKKPCIEDLYYFYWILF